MVLALLLLLAAPGSDEQRYKTCIETIAVDRDRAIAEAESWRAGGGGLPAGQCLGLAFAAAERWAPAAVAFEQAAREAELRRDGRAATLWVQAGNAALANNDPAQARTALDRALALPVLSDAMRGEALIDRARAAVVANDLAPARADLDAALRLVAGDPMGWLLSAALARRQGDLARAGKDIAEASRLAPGNPEIEAEKARIAEMRLVPEPAIKTP